MLAQVPLRSFRIMPLVFEYATNESVAHITLAVNDAKAPECFGAPGLLSACF